MSLAIGNVEDVAPVNASCQDVETVDTTMRYDLAKAALRRAKARGEDTSEVTEEFLASREALRGVLETIWPGR